MSSYPLTIESSSADVGSLMGTLMGLASDEGAGHEKDAVYEQSIMYDMVDALNNMETTENDLKAFKNYIEKERADENSPLHSAISAVEYTYDLDLQVYTQNVDGTIIKSDTMELLTDIMMKATDVDMSAMMNTTNPVTGQDTTQMMSSMGGMGGNSLVLWEEMLSGDNGSLVNDMVMEQYDVIYGSWPTEYNEVVLLVNENNELDDMTLYALGLKSEDEVMAVVDAVVEKTELEPIENVWSFEEICEQEYRVILNGECYTYDEETETYTDLRDTSAGLKYLYDNKAVPLKVSGIIQLKEDAQSGIINGSIAYTSALTEYVIEKLSESDIVTVQKENSSMDVFTGLPFEDNTSNLDSASKENFLRTHISELSDEEKAEIYIKIKSIPEEAFLNETVAAQMEQFDRETIIATLTPAITNETGMGEDEINEYLNELSDEDIYDVFEQILTEQVKMEYAVQVA